LTSAVYSGIFGPLISSTTPVGLVRVERHEDGAALDAPHVALAQVVAVLRVDDPHPLSGLQPRRFRHDVLLPGIGTAAVCLPLTAAPTG
jgi:hypothetical protein